MDFVLHPPEPQALGGIGDLKHELAAFAYPSKCACVADRCRSQITATPSRLSCAVATFSTTDEALLVMP